ncbi:hypothetical protein FA95DRAFT_280768 [Auriscalpium vulgare]|uniref:Uncharacterized protein n=1 Tax=Auriscalpium vulgare TaxID=40419 RepID=A0ACB8S5T2_9AGAM|nr:hypothetical protein FA95DRAFT_280768 [Auriscalpium vulgare]
MHSGFQHPMDPQNPMSHPSTSYLPPSQNGYARQPGPADMAAGMAAPVNNRSGPIPTPPPSAHGSISPVNHVQYANAPGQDMSGRRHSAQMQMQRISMPNISDQARIAQSTAPYGQPSQPRSLPQANVHAHPPTQVHPHQQQQQQQRPPPQYYVKQHRSTQPAPQVVDVPQRLGARFDTAAMVQHLHALQQAQPQNMRNVVATDPSAQGHPQNMVPQPVAPPHTPQQPTTLSDPALSTFNLLQPAKSLLEKTWATTVAVVQHELAAVAGAHAQVLAENTRFDQLYRKLYSDLQRSENTRVQLVGELEALRMAKGEGDASSREMQARLGECGSSIISGSPAVGASIGRGDCEVQTVQAYVPMRRSSRRIDSSPSCSCSTTRVERNRRD